jgi:hypothetical protein
MSAYPYGSGEHYPADPAHANYRREYNTRVVETAEQVGPESSLRPAAAPVSPRIHLRL